MRWESSDPASIYLPQSPHVTRSLFLSLGVGPSPVMMCPYVSSDLFPGVLHGLHVMLTVFLQLVFSPTLSKSPTSCVKAHCSHWGSDDASMPSSDPQWLQWAFTQLVGLFDRVGLKTNCNKNGQHELQTVQYAGN